MTEDEKNRLRWALWASAQSEGVTMFYGMTHARPPCFSEADWSWLRDTDGELSEIGNDSFAIKYGFSKK